MKRTFENTVGKDKNNSKQPKFTSSFYTTQEVDMGKCTSRSDFIEPASDL